MNNEHTVPMRDEGRTIGMTYRQDPILFQDIDFEGKAGTYRILAATCSQVGGEAQIFRCERASDGALLVAKIFLSDAMAVSSTNDKKREPLMEFLSSHSDHKTYHLMPLLDYGIISVNDGVYEQRHYIEVLPFCEGGDLGRKGRVDYDALVGSVIPDVNTALKALHSIRVIHRDIKPSNLYWLDGSIVLGDFGTSCYGGEEAGGRTVLRRGTLGYTAPEVGYGAAEVKSDYFSLGCTIGTLYAGRHFYQEEIDAGDSTAIYSRLSKGDVPIQYKEGHEALRKLIVGLLQIPIKDRFDGKMVDKWLENPSLVKEFPMWGVGDRYPSPLPFKDALCHTDAEVRDALAGDWETAKKYLYQGHIQNFYVGVNPKLTLLAEEIVAEAKASDMTNDYDCGLAKFLHELHPDGNVYWCGHTFREPAELLQMDKADVSAILGAKYLSWKYGKLADKGASANLEVIREMERAYERYPGIALHLFHYSFTKDDNELHYKGSRNADALFDDLVRDGKCYVKCEEYLFDDQFYAFLCFLRSTDVLALRTMIRPGELGESIRALFVLLEGMVEHKKEELREFYYRYGPDSYLYWLMEHVDLYEFQSFEATRIRDGLTKGKFHGGMSIQEMAERFQNLNAYNNQLRERLDGNPLLVSLGVVDYEKDVRAKSIDGYYLFDFLGEDVPLGFGEYLQKKCEVNAEYRTKGLRDDAPMTQLVVEEAEETVEEVQGRLEDVYTRLEGSRGVSMGNLFDAWFSILPALAVLGGSLWRRGGSGGEEGAVLRMLPSLLIPLQAVLFVCLCLYIAANVMDFMARKKAVSEMEMRLGELGEAKAYLTQNADGLIQRYRGLDGHDESWYDLSVGNPKIDVAKRIQSGEATYRLAEGEKEMENRGLPSLAHCLLGVGLGLLLIPFGWNFVDWLAARQPWYSGSVKPLLFILYCLLPLSSFFILRACLYGKTRISKSLCLMGECAGLLLMMALVYLSVAFVIVIGVLVFVLLISVVGITRAAYQKRVRDRRGW